MGVHGLETLIKNHSEKILKKPQYLHKMCTKLVIDGKGLEWYLLDQIREADPMSCGGDLRVLQLTIKSFFQNLMEHNCTPYVVFDGSVDLKDIKKSTSLERFKGKIDTVKTILYGQTGTLKPPLVSRLMKQVMQDMPGVKYAHSTFEADREIVILANYLKCPVLGGDTDFCVMDITYGYFPFNFLKWEMGKGVNFPISAKLFDQESFCKLLRVKKQLLPLSAILAGNDYVSPATLEAFNEYCYKRYPKTCPIIITREVNLLGITQEEPCTKCKNTKLNKAFRWIQVQYTLAEAIKNVVDIFPAADDQKRVRLLLSDYLKMYEVTQEGKDCVKSLLPSHFDGDDIDFTKNSQICRVVGAPPWVAEQQLKGTIPSLCVNILSKRCCKSKIQVENLDKECAWMPSELLFSVIIGIVLSGQPIPEGKTNNDCTVYIREGLDPAKHEVSPLATLEGFGELPSMCKIPNMSTADKQRLVLHTLSGKSGASNYSQLVKDFREDFRFALLVTLYWVNSTEVSRLHIASLLAGWVSLYEKKQQSGQTVENPLQTQEKEHPSTSEEPAWTAVRPKKTQRPKPDPVISHGFAQWQTCIKHALHLNDLLQHPLGLSPCPDISLLFSGVLMHRIYSLLQEESGGESLTQQVKRKLFNDAPEAYELFFSMYDFIIKGCKDTKPPRKT